MFLLIDNYDSFTYNLYHYFCELGIAMEVIRNDARSVEEVLSLQPQAIILSPGPCSPTEAGICLDLIAALPQGLPLLGVCLGHQSIGQHFGGRVERAAHVMHGKASLIQHQNSDIFKDLPNPFTATRYHSLIVADHNLPDCLTVTARTKDGVIMGLAHKDRQIFGVQFHPESIASQSGHHLLANFVEIATGKKPSHIPQHPHLAMDESCKAG